MICARAWHNQYHRSFDDLGQRSGNYRRAVAELQLDPTTSRMVILGAGSVGGAFGRLLALERQQPAEVVIVDQPERVSHAEQLTAELYDAGLRTRMDLTDQSGQLPVDSVCYDTQFSMPSATSLRLSACPRAMIARTSAECSPPAHRRLTNDRSIFST